MLIAIIGLQIVMLLIITLRCLLFINQLDSYYPPVGALSVTSCGPAEGTLVFTLESRSMHRSGLILLLIVSDDGASIRRLLSTLNQVAREIGATTLIMLDHHLIGLSDPHRTDFGMHRLNGPPVHLTPFLLVIRDGVLLRKGIINHLEHIESLVYAV